MVAEKEPQNGSHRMPFDPIPQSGVHGLPPSVVLAEQMTGALRRFLQSKGIEDWDVFFIDGDLSDIDVYLPDLGKNAKWEAIPALSNVGEQPAAMTRVRRGDGTRSGPELIRAGCLRLRDYEVVIARWYHVDLSRGWGPLFMYAAASPAEFGRLKSDISKLRHRGDKAVWQVLEGHPWSGDTITRDPEDHWDNLVLDPTIRKRLVTEVKQFFTEEVAGMYRQLGVPYRRGLLLYGSPGNGKTSLVRAIGAMNIKIPAMLLRPAEEFNDNSMQSTLRIWQDQAPAILVIEDLDWLFMNSKVSVSTFLNALDGVDRRDGGLLLVGTTNQPERLNPAINNRPGRFDVAIEVGPPDFSMRLEFFRRLKLGPLPERFLEQLAKKTDGLSFSHLREVASLSGFHAVQAGRTTRTEEDILSAADLVARDCRKAMNGFPEPTSHFGLAQGARGTR